MISPRPTVATASTWLVSWFLAALVAGMAAVNVTSCSAAQVAADKTAASAGEKAFAACALLYSTSNEMDAITEPIAFLEGLALKCGTASVEAVIASLESAPVAFVDAGAGVASAEASAPDGGAGPADVVQYARLRKAHRFARSAQLAAQVTR